MIHTGKSETLGAAQSMRPDASTVLLLKAWRVLESHWSPIHIRRSKKLNSSNSSSNEVRQRQAENNSFSPSICFSLPSGLPPKGTKHFPSPKQLILPRNIFADLSRIFSKLMPNPIKLTIKIVRHT